MTNDLLDLETVEMLKEMEDEDDPGFFAELVETYVITATETLHKLETAVADGDAPMAREYAHSLKGSSANIGASKMSAIAKIIEDTARGGSVDGMAERVRELQAVFPVSRQALEQLS